MKRSFFQNKDRYTEGVGRGEGEEGWFQFEGLGTVGDEVRSAAEGRGGWLSAGSKGGARSSFRGTGREGGGEGGPVTGPEGRTIGWQVGVARMEPADRRQVGGDARGWRRQRANLIFAPLAMPLGPQLYTHSYIHIYINVQMYKYTYHNCIRTYIGIHLSLFLAVFSPRPRLWHTLTGRIVRRKLPPTFATLISRLDECTCVKVTRFPDSTLRDRGGGRLKLGILRSLGYQRGRKFRVG